MRFQLCKVQASWNPLRLLVVPSLALLKSMRESPLVENEAARSLERSRDAHSLGGIGCRHSPLPTLPVHPIILSTLFSTCGRGGELHSIVRGDRQSGMEFPNVPSKVISVVQGDPVLLKVALVTTELEFRAARRANMDVSVAGQPEAATLAVGSLVRFTGTLTGYDRTPLMLHWQKARINPQDVPAASK